MHKNKYMAGNDIVNPWAAPTLDQIETGLHNLVNASGLSPEAKRAAIECQEKFYNILNGKETPSQKAQDIIRSVNGLIGSLGSSDGEAINAQVKALAAANHDLANEYPVPTALAPLAPVWLGILKTVGIQPLGPHGVGADIANAIDGAAGVAAEKEAQSKAVAGDILGATLDRLGIIADGVGKDISNLGKTLTSPDPHPPQVPNPADKAGCCRIRISRPGRNQDHC